MSSRSGVATLRTAVQLLLNELTAAASDESEASRRVTVLRSCSQRHRQRRSRGCSQRVRTRKYYVLYPGSQGKGSPYSITQRRVPELIPVLGSQPARDVSHKPGGRLPLLTARPAVTLATLKRAAINFAA